VSSLGGSRGLRNMAALMLFAIESHSSSQRPCPNQSMKPTASLQNKLTHSLPLFRPSAFPSMSHRFPLAPFSVFATTPCRGLSLSR
jgi:hypothetical protein